MKWWEMNCRSFCTTWNIFIFVSRLDHFISRFLSILFLNPKRNSFSPVSISFQKVNWFKAKMDFIPASEQMEASPPPPTPPAYRPTGKIFSCFITFKAVPFFIYMFSWIFCPWTIFQWVFTIISSAIDFWFTKNVAGRLILGMRWSNRINDRGESTWLFEFVQNLPPEKAGQRRTFWIILYASTGIWGLFSFFSLIKLNFGWLFVTSISLMLALSNTWGFMNCDRSIKNDLQNGAKNLFSDQVLPFITSNLINQKQNAQQQMPTL